MRIFRLPSKTGFNVKIIISYYLTIIICVVLFTYTRKPSFKKIAEEYGESSHSQPCVVNCKVDCPTPLSAQPLHGPHLPFVDLNRYFFLGMSTIFP